MTSPQSHEIPEYCLAMTGNSRCNTFPPEATKTFDKLKEDQCPWRDCKHTPARHLSNWLKHEKQAADLALDAPLLRLMSASHFPNPLLPMMHKQASRNPSLAAQSKSKAIKAG